MNWTLGILEVGVIPRLPLTLYLPDASADELIDPPCYCYVASDGERNVIVDSGPDRARSGAAGLEVLGDTAELLLAGLQAFGVDPADVACVVHTHLHHDHMQNDLMFPNAVVYVQRAEVSWATGPDCDRFYIGGRELVTALRGRLQLVEGDSELFPGLGVVLSKGHTPGHQSVLVDTAEGVVCLCGDIVSLFANVDVVGSICPNVQQTTAFLDRARSAGWEMVPSHDPKLREHRWYIRPPSDEAATSHQSEKKGGHLS
jgi:glyoxylase-like metal-dependent hydrolase (beta-lactamase superfamily II)